MQRRLVSLSGIALLQAHLLNVVQPLIRIHKDSCVVRLLLLALLRRFETLTEMAVLSELIEEVQVPALLVMVVKNCVLALYCSRWRQSIVDLRLLCALPLTHSNSAPSITICLLRVRPQKPIVAPRLHLLRLLALLLLHLILRDKPPLQGVLLTLGLTHGV